MYFQNLSNCGRHKQDQSISHFFLGLVCVRRYCEFLTEADHVQQVAWYVSQLRNEDQIDLYSQFLSTLKHEADKRLALSLAVENSLPVQDILSQVVKRIHDNEVSFNRSWHISTTPKTTKKNLFGLKLIQQYSMVILSCFAKKNQNLNSRKKSSVYY